MNNPIIVINIIITGVLAYRESIAPGLGKCLTDAGLHCEVSNMLLPGISLPIVNSHRPHRGQHSRDAEIQIQKIEFAQIKCLCRALNFFNIVKLINLRKALPLKKVDTLQMLSITISIKLKLIN